MLRLSKFTPRRLTTSWYLPGKHHGIGKRYLASYSLSVIPYQLGTRRPRPNMSASVTPAVTEARARLLSHFGRYQNDQSTGWSALWDEGDFLPWDKGFPNPALHDVLARRHDLIGPPISSDEDNTQNQPRRKTALVPGCGRGVDVLLLASFGYDAYGLEVSESAVRASERYYQDHSNDEEYAIKDQKIGRGGITFLIGDFFQPSSTWHQASSESQIQVPDTFDLIYDYTFFSALPPSLRPKWSAGVSSLLSPSPIGNLICVEFPTYKDAQSGGPPYASPSKAYMEYLSHPGEEIPLGKDGHVLGNPLREVSKGGLERVAHWKPERTHQVGMDEQGNVRDMVSIWRKTGSNRE